MMGGRGALANGLEGAKAGAAQHGPKFARGAGVHGAEVDDVFAIKNAKARSVRAVECDDFHVSSLILREGGITGGRVGSSPSAPYSAASLPAA